MKIQLTALAISTSLALGFVSHAQAAESADAARSDGFYGGVSYRDNAPGGMGVNFGAGPGLSRTPAAVVDEYASRTLLFGGYRWHNDLAVEAAVSSLDKYALRPLDTAKPATRRWPALRSQRRRIAKPQPKPRCVHELDHLQTVALYGRLGYVQAETPPAVRPFGDVDHQFPRHARRHELRRWDALRHELGAGAAPRVQPLRPLRRRNRQQPRPKPIRSRWASNSDSDLHAAWLTDAR